MTHLFAAIGIPMKCWVFTSVRAVIHIGQVLIDHEVQRISAKATEINEIELNPKSETLTLKTEIREQ
jgi:hypothetical protein